mmetsp:Transcript_14523/g.39295  ORF Transcript_14523/g.39295 Transcript_14523/m.39295 type:complete len:168 (+) Transcript_14523:98-601(+)
MLATNPMQTALKPVQGCKPQRLTVRPQAASGKVKAGTSKVGGSSKIGTSKIGTSKIGTSKIGSSKIKAGTTKKAAVEPESERLSIGPFTIPKLSDILARNEDNGPYTDEPSWFLVIGLLAVSFATAGYLVVTANSGYDVSKAEYKTLTREEELALVQRLVEQGQSKQ